MALPHCSAVLSALLRKRTGQGRSRRAHAPFFCYPQLLSFPQVEMFLLAYAVHHSIQVYRLSKHNTEEFVTVYPTDPPEDWPTVTLIAEDDRHYNVPVRVCEETSL